MNSDMILINGKKSTHKKGDKFEFCFLVTSCALNTNLKKANYEVTDSSVAHSLPMTRSEEMTESCISAVISNLRHEGEKSAEKIEISPRSSSK